MLSLITPELPGVWAGACCFRGDVLGVQAALEPAAAMDGQFCVPRCIQDKMTVSLALVSLDALEFCQRNTSTASIS